MIKDMLLVIGIIAVWAISSEMDYQDAQLVAECETEIAEPNPHPELSEKVAER